MSREGIMRGPWPSLLLRRASYAAIEAALAEGLAWEIPAHRKGRIAGSRRILVLANTIGRIEGSAHEGIEKTLTSWKLLR
jgi:hypothetical protein